MTDPAIEQPPLMRQRSRQGAARPGRRQPDYQAAQARPASGSAPANIYQHAVSTGADPCEVAESAIPAHIVNDLNHQDLQWLNHHTNICQECEDLLHSYQQLGTVLDHLATPYDDQRLTPPSLPFLTSDRDPSSKTVDQQRRARPRLAMVREVHHVTAEYTEIASPLGPLLVAASPAGVCEIGFLASGNEDTFVHRLRERGYVLAESNQGDALAATIEELTQYFAGHRNHFSVPIDLEGVTPFTRGVLSATSDVPFGRLSTYADVAARIGSPRAMRAVGNALGRNPVPVIVPCHRIVRSDLSLGGYTGGIAIKERLLALEGASLALSTG